MPLTGTRSRLKRPLGTVPPRDPPMSPTPVRGVAPMMVATETHAIEPCGCEEAVALRASVERRAEDLRQAWSALGQPRDDVDDHDLAQAIRTQVARFDTAPLMSTIAALQEQAKTASAEGEARGLERAAVLIDDIAGCYGDDIRALKAVPRG